MKVTCILCALAIALLLDSFSRTCAEETSEDAPRESSAWLTGNRMFHDLFQRQARWGGRNIRPQGRIPRAYQPLDESDDTFNVYRRWGSRRMPYRGAGHKRDWEEQIPNAHAGDFKRADDNEQAMLDGVYQYLRN